ncbi:sn-glycerol-3-phosphate ABC transporter ATP-binding protein UgpC [uncultured Martelella sp.]|uniref:ABC transporter ATP-binding protein n=1 Tax=uncultured Martelella sp. TaxID=392331 RepID=UPI0029C6AB0A|nr:sn-glycerol-3-phosphate ABC transporter ATP-binding protein UgpC [uncultured Martelella sp.]
MANVRIQNAVKTFGKSKILNDIDIDIRDGEFLILVGPSGCGKSTLLRMIAGLESFSSGNLLIGGEDVTALHPKKRDIAMVFQNYALYPHMTVERNMGFSLELAKIAKEERRRQVARASEILGLGHLLDRYPRQLSGGQRQRVAMGRAIVRNPSLFLFDEPLSNLDAQLRVEMRAEIKSLHQRLGSTIIYVTHDQIEAMTMADRIALMNKGVVEQIGTPMELYERPANTFVARFIGSPSMNLIDVEVVEKDGNLALSAGTGDVVATLPRQITMNGKKHVQLGVRPEDFVISDTGFPAEITLVEPTGSETQALCRCGDTQITVLLRDRERVDPGMQLRLKPKPDRIHLFDAETGKAIPVLS